MKQPIIATSLRPEGDQRKRYFVPTLTYVFGYEFIFPSWLLTPMEPLCTIKNTQAKSLQTVISRETFHLMGSVIIRL